VEFTEVIRDIGLPIISMVGGAVVFFLSLWIGAISFFVKRQIHRIDILHSEIEMVKNTMITREETIKEMDRVSTSIHRHLDDVKRTVEQSNARLDNTNNRLDKTMAILVENLRRDN